MHPFFIFGFGTITGLLASALYQGKYSKSSEIQAKVAEAQEKFPMFAEEIATWAKQAEAYGVETEGLAAGVLSRVPGLTESVAMYYAMLDPDTPTLSKATIAAALLYLIDPVDVIPDTIPVVGQLDDAGVVFAAFAEVYRNVKPEHLERAQAWLINHGIEPKPIFEIGRAVELEYPKDGKQLPEPASFGFARTDLFGVEEDI
jgi:uncharacterized membrane protein YkvA (DUF1232 family)